MRRSGLPWTPLERVAVALVAVALAGGLIIVLAGGIEGRDPSALATTTGIGAVFADQGDAVLGAAQHHPRYDSTPPTSGPHRRASVLRDTTRLSSDQLLTSLAAGDIVIEYPPPAPPPGLAALAGRLGGTFSPALAADGEAVVLAPRRGTRGLIALAWRRMLTVTAPDDPLLAAFVQAWLGRGAGLSARRRSSG